MQVPGEMFALAMKARQERGMGVVGSTSNILDFIASKVFDAIKRPFPERIQVCVASSPSHAALASPSSLLSCLFGDAYIYGAGPWKLSHK